MPDSQIISLHLCSLGLMFVFPLHLEGSSNCRTESVAPSIWWWVWFQAPASFDGRNMEGHRQIQDYKAPFCSIEASYTSCPLLLLFTIYNLPLFLNQRDFTLLWFTPEESHKQAIWKFLKSWLLITRVKTRIKKTSSMTCSCFFNLNSRHKEYLIEKLTIREL